MLRHIRVPVMLVLVAAALTALPAAAAAPATTGAAVTAERQVLAADAFDLAAYRGRVVLLDFWASWCKPCRKSMPWLSELQRRYGDRGLQIVAVNLDRKAADAREMIAALDPGIIVVMDPDGELASGYDLKGMPTSILVGPDGTTLASHLGFLESEQDAREQEIEHALPAAAQQGK